LEKRAWPGTLGGGDEFVLYLPINAKDARQFLTATFASIRAEALKKWPKYGEAVATRKLSRRSLLPLTYSAGVIQLKPGEGVVRAEHAADILCKMAKHGGKGRGRTTNTISSRSSTSRLERQLAKKQTKI